MTEGGDKGRKGMGRQAVRSHDSLEHLSHPPTHSPSGVNTRIGMRGFPLKN